MSGDEVLELFRVAANIVGEEISDHRSLIVKLALGLLTAYGFFHLERAYPPMVVAGPTGPPGPPGKVVYLPQMNTVIGDRALSDSQVSQPAIQQGTGSAHADSSQPIASAAGMDGMRAGSILVIRFVHAGCLALRAGDTIPAFPVGEVDAPPLMGDRHATIKVVSTPSDSLNLVVESIRVGNRRWLAIGVTQINPLTVSDGFQLPFGRNQCLPSNAALLLTLASAPQPI
jgi:hypothetical protein